MSEIVLLAARGAATNIVYHALAREFGDIPVILEDAVPRQQIIKRRLKALGAVTVLGQILFMLLIERPLRRRCAARLREIPRERGLSDAALPAHVHQVATVNSDETRALLKQLAPRVVVINGTRIISQQTLAAVNARFLNIHVGITPAYRGVHGGYWALAEGRPELAGSTVHFVDKGIDTGQIIAQVPFQATAADTFVTYPILQTSTAIPGLLQAVRGVLTETLQPESANTNLPSRLYSHPTIWQYLYYRIMKGVR